MEFRNVFRGLCEITNQKKKIRSEHCGLHDAKHANDEYNKISLNLDGFASVVVVGKDRLKCTPIYQSSTKAPTNLHLQEAGGRENSAVDLNKSVAKCESREPEQKAWNVWLETGSLPKDTFPLRFQAQRFYSPAFFPLLEYDLCFKCSANHNHTYVTCRPQYETKKKPCTHRSVNKFSRCNQRRNTKWKKKNQQIRQSECNNICQLLSLTWMECAHTVYRTRNIGERCRRNEFAIVYIWSMR